MRMKGTACCAIQEIDGLSDQGSAKQSMMAFCKLNLTSGVRFGGAPGDHGTIYSFYLFTAALGGYAGKSKYGENFEKLIRANKLGEVWASPKRVNLAFHDDHQNQVWIWMPDVVALRKWWEREKVALRGRKCGCGAPLNASGCCPKGCDDQDDDEDD